MAYYRWGRLLKVETAGSDREPAVLSIQELGQLRSREERRQVFQRSLWARVTRRPAFDVSRVTAPGRQVPVENEQLRNLPRSIEPGELVMLVFASSGTIMNANIGLDHPHGERCVAVPGCRSRVLWVRDLTSDVPVPREARADRSISTGGGSGTRMSDSPVIGTASMETDGTITLRLRAEEPAGAIGDAVLIYPPSDEHYARILDHLGGLRPGEEKPVPPFPE